MGLTITVGNDDNSVKCYNHGHKHYDSLCLLFTVSVCLLYMLYV